MTHPDTLPRLQRVFDRVFLEPPELTPQLTAAEVPEWDSLLQISVLVAVEKEFNIRFRVGEVEAARNIGEFAALIEKRMAEK